MKERTEPDNGLVLRDWSDGDTAHFEEMIRRTWWESEGITRPMQERISECFLMETLREQTFMRVAELDGKPVGVIMGSDLRHRHSSMRESWNLAVSALGILIRSEGRRLLHEFGGEALNHRELDRKGGNLSYDAEIVFFMVDDTIRGKGIGKALWKDMMDHFRETGVRTWRVYTDTDCSYGFYEHMGAVRRSENSQTYETEDGKEGHITYFLYDCGVKD